jgi:hypothetical protein
MSNANRISAHARGWHGLLGSMLMLALLSGCEKYALDRQMEELCKKDGGVKVYETVTLPPEMFDQWGNPFPEWGTRTLENRLGPDFLLITDKATLKNGEPLKGDGRLTRYTEKIYRRADGKLLGEAVEYGRSGGDFIVIEHPTSKHCPVLLSVRETLIGSTFLKSGN